MQRVVLSGGVVDLVARTFQRHDGGEVRLTPRERDLLGWLAARPARIVSREELLEQVWNYAPTVQSRAVDKTMVGLRTKVEVDPADPHHLLTERGVGYRFVPVDGPRSGRLPGREVELGRTVGALVAGGPVTVTGLPGSGRRTLVRVARAAAGVGVDVDLVAAAVPRGLPSETVVTLVGLPRAAALHLLTPEEGEADGWAEEDLDGLAAMLDDLPGRLLAARARLPFLTPERLLEDPRQLDEDTWIQAALEALGSLGEAAGGVARAMAVLAGPARVEDLARASGHSTAGAVDAIRQLEVAGMVVRTTSAEPEVDLLGGLRRALRTTPLSEERAATRAFLVPELQQALSDCDGQQVQRGTEWFARHAADLDGLAGTDTVDAAWCLLGAAAASRLGGAPVPERLEVPALGPLLTEDPVLADTLGIERARSLMLVSRFSAAERVFAELSKSAHSPETRRTAVGGRSWALRVADREDEARALLAGVPTPRRSYGSGLILLEAAVLQHALDPERCLAQLREVSPRLESEGWLRLAATAQLHTGMVAAMLGALDLAEVAHTRARDLSERIGNHHGSLLARTNLCDVALRAGRLDDARRGALDVLPDASASGAEFTMAVLHVALATIALLRAEHEPCETHAVSAMLLLSPDLEYHPQARALRAMALLGLGLPGAAREAIDALEAGPALDLVRYALGEDIEVAEVHDLPDLAEDPLLHTLAVAARRTRLAVPRGPLTRSS